MKTGMLLKVSVLLLGLVVVNCGGGEQATPTPQVRPPATLPAPTPTPRAAQAAPTAVPTATPAAPTAAPRPTPTQALAPTPTGGARAPQGKLTVVMSSFGSEEVDPRHLHPSSASAGLAPMYDWLLWRDLEGKLVPGVATKWESAPDGLSVSLTLRDGMVFHNGERITAADVKFSIERFPLPDSLGTGAGQWKGFLNTVETPTASTAIIRFKQPWFVVAPLLAPPDQTIGVVLPKASVERLGEKEFFNNHQFGSGPWKFVDRKTSVGFTYEAWEQKHPFRPTPEFKTAQFLLIGEESTRVAMLRTGAANLAAVSPDTAKTLRSAGFPLHQVTQGTQTRFLFWGTNNPQALQGKPTAKREVREALSLAVDRQAIVDSLLGGLTKIPLRDVVNIGMEGYDTTWKSFPYDPARAKQLLAEAGYPNGGFSVDLYNPPLPSAPWTPRAGEALASYWEAIGVRARVIPIEYGGYRPLFRQYPHQTLAGAWGWLPGAVGETSGLIFAQWHTNGASQRISIPEIDALIDRVPRQADPGERVRLIREVVERAYQLWISIPFAYDLDLYAAGPDVGAWDPLILGPGFSWERIKRKGN